MVIRIQVANRQERTIALARNLEKDGPFYH